MATAWPVFPAVFFEGEIVGFEAGVHRRVQFGEEEGSSGLFGIERVGNDDVFRLLAHADEGDVGVVLGDDDALVIDAGFDLDVDAAVFSGEGVVVHRHLDGGGNSFVASMPVLTPWETRTWTS